VLSLVGEEVQTMEDLAPVIELYHHTIGAGRYDEAARLLQERLVPIPLFYRFGAYQTCIELLRGLFPSEEDPLPGSEQSALPRLESENDRGWALNALANSYALYGQPWRAVPLYEAGITLREGQGLKDQPRCRPWGDCLGCLSPPRPFSLSGGQYSAPHRAMPRARQ
jgi:hypothetical protein